MNWDTVLYTGIYKTLKLSNALISGHSVFIVRKLVEVIDSLTVQFPHDDDHILEPGRSCA